MDWLKNQFVPRRESGNVLDFAVENDIIHLCLPSDTTRYLQPLFRSFFKPLTTFWQQAVNNWIHSNRSRKITRLQFGGLLTAAWNQAAAVGNDSAGFSACGIYSYDPPKIPHHAFAISDRCCGRKKFNCSSRSGKCQRTGDIFQHSSHRLGGGLLQHQAQILLLLETHLSKIF